MVSGIAIALLCILFLSCHNEDLLEGSDPGKADNRICFGIITDGHSRAGNVNDNHENGRTSNRFVLRSDSTDTLCVRTIVSDGIHPSAFNNRHVITRGTPIIKDESGNNFYSSFRVLAYWQKDGVSQSQFYMDEEVSEQADNLWSNSDRIYYWPGEKNTLRFYAWAPTNVFIAPKTPESTMLSEYRVPATVIDQQDLVVATTNAIAGNHNASQPLTFRHICTAVRFAVGKQMQPGTIESVALKGVYSEGNYDMAKSQWTLTSTTADFIQEFANGGKPMTGTETSGTEITPLEGTFMMLPQTLPPNATLEVIFKDNITGNTRTLSASIAGTTWEIDQTITYTLSISPEYEMTIKVPEEEQDAHFISFDISVTIKDFTEDWTLTSNLPEDVTFTTTKTELQKQGYWIEDDKGQSTITETGSGTFNYHVYVTENIGNTTRDLNFQIKPKDAETIPSTAKVKQLCPSWDESKKQGYERIEEEDGGNYPFGFKWDRKVVFTAEPKLDWEGNLSETLRNLFGAYIFRNLAQAAKEEHHADYITIEEEKRRILLLNLTVKTTVTIDYSQVSSLIGLTTDDDGLTNTRKLYFHKGIGEIADMENQLRANAVGNFKEESSGEDKPESVENFAARMAVIKKNKFTRKAVTVTVEGSGETKTIWIPNITSEAIVWYLPARIEQQSIIDTEYPLSGEYWSSTAVENGQNAYQYNSNHATATKDRMETFKIRAARRKQ